MAESVATGVIEIVGDARKLRAAIAEAKNSLRTLGEGQKDISRQASASIDRYVGSLIAQSATLNKSAREQEIYKLALRGASDEQIKAATVALKSIERHEKNAESLRSLGRAAAYAGTAIVAAFTAAAVAIDQLTKQAAQFKDLSEKTGETAENIASFAVAAKASGKSVDEVAKFMVGLNKNLVGVDDDAEKAGAAIQALGLDLAKFKTLSPAEQIDTLARSIKQFEEGQGKANVMEALAKGGSDLLPVLNKVSGEIGRQAILTQEQIDLADEYTTKQAVIRAQIELQAAAIATEMIPALSEFTGAIFDTIKQIIGLEDGMDALARSTAIRDFADSASKSIAVVIDGIDLLIRAFQLAGKSIAGFSAAMSALQRGEFRAALAATQALGEDLRKIVDRPLFSTNLENRRNARQDGVVTNQTPPQDRKILNFQGAKKKPPSAEDDSARQLARAQLQLDLELIKEAGDAQVEAFRRAESIMQAMRSASLVDDREYFASKLGFINAFAQEEEAALQAQIERRQREVFSGKNAAKDELDNQREIAKLQAQISKIRADAVTKTVINSIEERAAIEKIKQAYLDAKDAAEAYLGTIARRNARELEGIGRGQRFRETNAGRSEIEDRAQAERRRLQGELRRQQITRQQFDAYLSVVEETYRREVEMYEARTDAIDRAQSDWLNGAREALENYIDQTRDVAKQFEEVFSNGFRSAEDAIINLTSGGVKSFRDLGQAVEKFALGVAQDLARIEIRQNFLGPLAEFLKQPGRLEGIGDFLGIKRPGQAPRLVGSVVDKVPTELGGIASAANDAKFATTVAAAGTSFSTQVQASGTSFATEITTAATTAGTTLQTELSTAATTLTTELSTVGTTAATELTTGAGTAATELTTAGTTVAGEIIAAGTTFAGTINAAAAQFATTVSAASAGNGAASLLGGGASFMGGFTDLVPSVLGSFASGTQNVPQTGPYLLHQGERVITAADNQASKAMPPQQPMVVNIHQSFAPGTNAQTVAQAAVATGQQVRRAQNRAFAGGVK